MSKTVTVTLRRVFYKEVEVTLDNKMFEGKTDEEIQTILMEDNSPHEDSFEEKLLENAELHEGKLDDEYDRFDIFDSNGLGTYGILLRK
jgi:hypothetical protein